MTTDSKFHVYLISSLPMLHFGARPPFSFEKFLSMCEGLIPGEEISVLRQLDIVAASVTSHPHPTLKRWAEFEMALRNELVRIRAARKKLDPQKHLRLDGYSEPHLYQAALQAYRNPSPLEGEKALDQERWRFLEELSLGHYFDMDFLIIYALKLLILRKWEKVETADSHALVESAI